MVTKLLAKKPFRKISEHTVGTKQAHTLNEQTHAQHFSADLEVFSE